MDSLSPPAGVVESFLSSSPIAVEEFDQCCQAGVEGFGLLFERNIWLATLMLCKFYTKLDTYDI